MSLKKPRADAKLLNLPEEQQAQLADWLLAGMPYHAAKEAVAKEFKVSCSLSALSGFYSEVCVPVLLKRRSQAVMAAEEIASEASRTPGRFDAATVDAIKQKAFELAISQHAKPKDVKALFMLLQKSRDQDLKSQTIDLARDKFQFSAAEACLAHLPSLRAIATNPKLDQRAKIDAIRRQLFGVLPQEKPISAA
ncbi:MAG: hypothetical protein U1G08_18095 [Verrucomicrobiota bacterium]